MASEQARRGNVEKEREVKVEKDKVPKSLSHGGQDPSGKGRDSGVHVTHAATESGQDTRGRIHGGGEAAAVFGQEGPGRVGVELTGEGREDLESRAHGFHGEKARHAQLLAAGGEEMKERKGQESLVGSGGGGRNAIDTVTEKGRQAKESVAQGAYRASEEKGRETGHVAAKKGQEASEQAGRAKDYTMEKGQEAKEQTVSITGKAKDYTVQKTGEAMEMSKEAAAVGWTAAHFTTEKVVQGTKAVAGTVEGAVGYAGHKAAEVGSKAVDLTKEKAAAAADTVVGYTAKKKEEAEDRDQEIHQGGEEEKRTGFVTEPRRGFGEEHEKERASGEDVFGYGVKGMVGEARRDVGEEELYGGGRWDERYVKEEGVGEGGVLGAVGETIAEIPKTTTNLVIGDAPGRTREHGTTDYMGHEHGRR